MRKASPETWVTVLTLIGLIIAPIILGWIILKVYRKLHPPIDIGDDLQLGFTSDRVFLKSFLIGLFICLPIYFWLFSLDL